MFIEQIIEFELRGPGPSGCTCIAKTDYFLGKAKISKINLQVNYYLLLKILQDAMYLASLHLDQDNYKIYLKKLLCFKHKS